MKAFLLLFSLSSICALAQKKVEIEVFGGANYPAVPSANTSTRFNILPESETGNSTLDLNLEHSFKAKIGFTGGLRIRRKLNDYVSLSAGLATSMIRIQPLVRVSTSSSSAPLTFNPGTDLVIVPVVTSPTATPISLPENENRTTAWYLQMPILAEVYPLTNKRISIGAGLYVSTLLQARSYQTNFAMSSAAPQNGSPAWGTVNQPPMLSGPSAPPKTEYKKTDAYTEISSGAQLVLAYRILPRMRVEALIQTDFFPIMKESIESRMTLLSLGAAYRLY
jgi:hypothetical protein